MSQETQKIRCGGLIERADLCLVEVLGIGTRSGTVGAILGKFGDAEISLNYLSIGRDFHGQKNLSFCVSTARLAEHRNILEEIEKEHEPRLLRSTAPVIILTLYGPHFLEKHNLASQVFTALCHDDIDAVTVTFSVNSISVVINIPDRDRAVECLRQKFEWPE